MNKEYLKNLYKQYISARGIKGMEINLEDPRFKNWLLELKEQTIKYKNYIEMTNNINIECVLELNKGFYDSISGYKTKIVSEYANTFNRKNSNIKFKDIILVLTQNPFNLNELDVFQKIAINNIDFIVGLYGSTDDKDISLKYLYIKHYLESVLELDIMSDYIKDNGVYYNVFKNKK